MRISSMLKHCKNKKCGRYELHTIREDVFTGIIYLVCLACRYESKYPKRKEKQP